MISTVLPAFNEAERIGRVIQPLLESSLISRIIVVDDGSSDHTADVVRQYPVELLQNPYNRGKAEAVKLGLRQCREEETILLLDADLIGLTQAHIELLTMPILSDHYDMTIGIFSSGRLITNTAQKIAPYLSGQRAFKGCFIQDILNLEATGYSIELALNSLSKTKGMKVKRVALENISHVMKEEKLGLIDGTIFRLKMYHDMIKYWLN